MQRKEKSDVRVAVQRTLTRVLADDRISVSVVGEVAPAPASAINPAIVHTLEGLSARLYGGLPIVPVMDNGASDGKYLRIAGIPAYGVPGVFTDVDDDRAGLCASCVHAQLVTSSRGSTFYLCRLSFTDPRFPRYPPLPVVTCAGYEPAREPANPRTREP